MIVPPRAKESNVVGSLISNLFIRGNLLLDRRSKEILLSSSNIYQVLLRVFFFLYFVSEGTLNFFELNTLEKSSSFHLLIHVNCQLNWNFYPLILESLADGTNRIDVKAVIRQTSIIRFFSFLLASSLYFSKKKKISNSTHRPSIDPLRLENSLLPVITRYIYI